MLPTPIDTAGGQEAGVRAPRSPARPGAARVAAGFTKPDETCDNPNCKEMRRVERTMVNNLKQEVATLKMQLSQLSQQVDRDVDDSEEAAKKQADFDAETSALRRALTEEAHAHGVAIAESSSKIAALNVQLAASQKEVHDLKEKRALERGKVKQGNIHVQVLLGALADTEPAFAELLEQVQGLQARKRADAVDITQRSAAAELEETAEKVRQEAAEVQARLQARMDAVEARADGLKMLSLRQANALGLAALAEKQATKQIDKAKQMMLELKEKHREEIEKRRRAALVFSTLCAQQVVRAKATAAKLRTRVGELEEEKRGLGEEKADVEAALAAERAEAELRLKEADARVSELEAKRALAAEQATALANTVAVVSQKQKATAHKLHDVEEARAQSEAALEGAMGELRSMAGELQQLQGSVQTQMAVMEEALEHRDATGGLVQEVLRLALRRLRALEETFGELITGYVDDGLLHGALAATLKSTAHIDLVALSNRSAKTVHAAGLFDHFPLHSWRLYQLSHTMQLAVRLPPKQAQRDEAGAQAHRRRGGFGGLGGFGAGAGEGPHATGGADGGVVSAMRKLGSAPLTAALVADLDQRGSFLSQPPQGPQLSAVAAVAAARAAGMRARTPQAAVAAASRARSARRAAVQSGVLLADGENAAQLLLTSPAGTPAVAGERSASRGSSRSALGESSALSGRLPPVAGGAGAAAGRAHSGRPHSSGPGSPSPSYEGTFPLSPTAAGAIGGTRGRAATAAAAAAAAAAAGGVADMAAHERRATSLLAAPLPLAGGGSVPPRAGGGPARIASAGRYSPTMPSRLSQMSAAARPASAMAAATLGMREAGILRGEAAALHHAVPRTVPSLVTD